MKKDLWQRAEELFHAALELSPEARRDFLYQACGEDIELRRQVETLLSQDEQAGSFLEKPALAGAIAEEFHMIGKTLGHYRISSQIGKGGMGEVFQAKDQVLGRDVAIKLLPGEFAQDADRVSRFQREAKVLASLNHPNIAAIYGLEKSGETNFLVLELVEGETLAERIKAGSVSVEESLKLALQIAEALEAAHEKGVIHRDLKPANIKVTPDGKVKVLDFGLAKAFAGEQADMNLSDSPTLSAAATRQGIILGTAAYMSPEQAKGKAVDKRADIWAFGCVLYEMLTGQAAFQGEDITEILASVVKGEANLDLLPANLNPRVREAITRCLHKDLRRRYQGISDASYEIGQALAIPGGILTPPVTTAEPRNRLRIMLPWIAATAILGVIIGGLVVWKFRPAEPHDVISSEFSLPDGQQFADLYTSSSLDVSRDGKQVVYSAAKGLYIRSVSELTAKPIAGIEEKTFAPFFSPDGKWIGYFTGPDFGKLKKIAVGGGAPEVLCNASGRGWWDEDGTIIYATGDDIMRVSAEGGTPESILNLKSGSLSRPQMLPDGKSLLYTSRPNNGQPKIIVQTLKSGQAKELFTGLEAQYVPTGHIIYRLPNNNNLFAVQFDLAGLNIKGQSASILEGIAQYAISQSGTLAYIPVKPGAAAATKILAWVNREGKEEALPVPPNNYHKIRISPDGKQVALEVTTPNANIWVWDIIGKNMRPLTSDEGTSNASPLWTIDGKRILYTWDRKNVFRGGGVYWKAADGTGEVEKLASVAGRGLFPCSLSPDGKSLVLWEIVWSPTLHQAIGMLSMEGDHAMRELLHDEKYSVQAPRVSPNGRWMAYESYESGKPEIYVCSFPDAKKGTLKISTNGGNSPLWSPDGRELFYNNVDLTMAVPVETEPQFRINGMPAVLFRGTAGKDLGPMWADMANFTYWDIDPDPKHLRFLTVKDLTEAPRRIHIVVNWFEELKRHFPTK
jgi:eukaryotic-like serine/threonine-protein kinase